MILKASEFTNEIVIERVFIDFIGVKGRFVNGFNHQPDILSTNSSLKMLILQFKVVLSTWRFISDKNA